MENYLQEIPKIVKEIPTDNNARLYATGITCNIGSMKIGERIKEAREKAGLSQSDLARKMGVKSSSVQEWEKNETSPRRHRIEKLAETLNVTPFWLEFGTEPSGSKLKLVDDAEKEPEPFPTEKYAFIPRYEAKTSAGAGYHNGDHVEISKTHAFRIDWIKKNNWREEDLCVVEASGHSMEPKIGDGDVLLVNTSEKEFESGRVYMILFPGGGLRAKRVHRMADGRIKISSDNPDKAQFPDEYYSPEEATHLNIVGKVVQREGEV